jgi:hypothetical protein
MKTITLNEFNSRCGDVWTTIYINPEYVGLRTLLDYDERYGTVLLIEGLSFVISDSPVRRLVTGEYAQRTVDYLLAHRISGQSFPEPRCAGYFLESAGVFTAFDNTTGDCWIESFDNEADARAYALGDDSVLDKLGI